MGFIRPCFIRKNTEELRKKLEELGYYNYGNPFQITDNTMLATTIDGEYVPYKVPLDDSWIDCGTNEAMFLALAALRDDTSNHQWWVFDTDYGDYKKGDWIEGKFGRCSCYCHVATSAEIIEHFKTKEL